MQFDKESMKARFWELKAQVESIKDQIAAIQAERDASDSKAFEAQCNEQIKALKVSSDILSLENELAFLARGLGNVGEDPALSAAPAE